MIIKSLHTMIGSCQMDVKKDAQNTNNGSSRSIRPRGSPRPDSQGCCCCCCAKRAAMACAAAIADAAFSAAPGGNGADVMVNSLVNNITNMTLALQEAGVAGHRRLGEEPATRLDDGLGALQDVHGVGGGLLLLLPGPMVSTDDGPSAPGNSIEPAGMRMVDEWARLTAAISAAAAAAPLVSKDDGIWPMGSGMLPDALDILLASGQSQREPDDRRQTSRRHMMDAAADAAAALDGSGVHLLGGGGGLSDYFSCVPTHAFACLCCFLLILLIFLGEECFFLIMCLGMCQLNSQADRGACQSLEAKAYATNLLSAAMTSSCLLF